MSRTTADFAQEVLLRFIITQHMLDQELQRDRPFELGLFGLIDDTHAALAELLDDLVMADGGADRQGNCSVNRSLKGPLAPHFELLPAMGISRK